MTTVLIVDDEAIARSRLRKLLSGMGDIEIVGEAADGMAAAETIASVAPDVVLLDIHMPGIDGFEVIESLPEGRHPEIVFVTAYDSFAVRAFEKHAVDYLLKPVEPERLRLSLDRARERLAAKSHTKDSAALSDDLLRQTADTGTPRRLLIRVEGKLVVLEVGDIEWIEAAGNYAIIHTEDQKYITRRTMKALEARLDTDHFARVHRSTIVNIGRVKHIEPHYNNDYRIMLESGTTVPLSRTFRDDLTARMDEI